jgi:hypothetical protein
VCHIPHGASEEYIDDLNVPLNQMVVLLLEGS